MKTAPRFMRLYEIAAVMWLESNGFAVEVKKQCVGNTVFAVSKDGRTDEFSMPSSVEDTYAYMEMYAKSFEVGRELRDMRDEIEVVSND